MMNHTSDSSGGSGISGGSLTSTPAWYELRIDGRLGLRSALWFEDMAVTVNEETTPPQTVIRGHVRDQAALYGLIGRARDLGLTLISVRRVEPQEAG